MRARALSLVAAMALLPLAVRAQHAGGSETVGETRAPREATQYDFLVGQWELTVTPKVSGLVGLIHGAPKLRGSWKGARALDGWGIEDELRIADESGNPVAYTHFVRMYDAKAKRLLDQFAAGAITRPEYARAAARLAISDRAAVAILRV